MWKDLVVSDIKVKESAKILPGFIDWEDGMSSKEA